MIKQVTIVALLAAPSAVFGQADQLQLVREIGVETGPEEYSFGQVGGIALTPRNEILVLDSQAKLVRRFDLAGKYLGTFGREGAGPGEFQLPRMRVVRNEIWVSDPRLQRLTVFTLEGDVVRTLSPPAALGVVDVAYPLRDGSWLGVKSVSNFSSQHVREITAVPASRQSSVFASWRANNKSRLVLAREQTTSLDTIASWDPGAIPWFAEEGRAFGFVRGYWGSLAEWGLGGDTIVAFVSSIDGTLKVWLTRSGRLDVVRTGRLPIAPQPITEAEVTRLAREEQARTGKSVRLIAPPFKGQLAAPIVSNNGDVWILRTVQDPFSDRVVPGPNYLVVPIDGRAQFQVTVPAGFTLYAVVDDFLLGKRKTDNDVDIVQVWRLR